MRVAEYVDSLFEDQPHSADMKDFKEEICANLQERINYLINKGVTEAEAFQKATAELGDISAIADQISDEKRKEVIGSMYVGIKNYMQKWQIIGYTLAGGLLLLGIILTLTAYFATGEIVVGIGSTMVFIVVPICGFVFLGLTQETAESYPMVWKRALFYVAAVGAILFGLLVFTLLLIQTHGYDQGGADRNVAAIGSLIPFVLPGIAVLVFLILSEKNRRKPWVIERDTAWEEGVRKQFTDPFKATRFGLYSGALWVLSAALFVILGFMIGFQHSWPVFLVTLAVQMLILAWMIPKNKLQ